MSLLVKICGLTTPDTLSAALVAGADMVGFVFFPPSPRHVSLSAARELGRDANGRALKVALTVDADDATLANIVETLHPDLLQLHGRETVARIRDLKQRFGLPVMKAIPIETAADLASLAGYAEVCDRILFDARAPKDATRPGGLGAAFDWHLLQDLQLDRPFMVVATQNPFEFEGTYYLPENQLDRFLLRISLGYPERSSEHRILTTQPGRNERGTEQSVPRRFSGRESAL